MSQDNKSSPSNILIIEDDVETAEHVAETLVAGGLLTELAHDGAKGLAMAQSGQFDVLIVDRMLPELDGLSIVETLRDEGNFVPVIFLSALSETQHKVEGLASGGDDYVSKDADASEILARVHALLRRAKTPDSPVTELSLGDLSMDLLKRRVMRGEQKIDLQPREFMLLEYLLRNADQIVTRTMLLENVWNYHFDPQTNVIDVHISRLRGKIDKEFGRPLLHTIRGAGYRLSLEA